MFEKTGKNLAIICLPVLLAAPVAAGDEPVSCNPNPPYLISSSDNVPCDFPANANGGMSHLNLARFAWNTFIGINYPAMDPSVKPYVRGAPDGSYGDVDPLTVWDSWREKRELYSIRKDGSSFVYVAPPAWNGAPATTDGNPNPDIPPCPGITIPTGGHITGLQTSKVENYLDESDEIGLAVLWRKTFNGEDQPMPNEHNLLRYQVKFNWDYYTHVAYNELWDTKTLNEAIATSPNGFSVILPAGDNPTGTTGTILTKSAWKWLDGSDDPSRYYTREALYYRGSGEDTCFDYASFGLIAIHVIRKTTSFPYYFYSTFEHVDNWPGKFYYANTNGQGPMGTNSTLPNAYGVQYRDPSNPGANYQSPPYQANRLITPAPDVVTANNEAATLNAGKVWANYQLVGIQYKPVDPPVPQGGTFPGGFYKAGSPPTSFTSGAGYNPQYFSDQDFYLANAVVETNQAFQFFTGGAANHTINNIFLYSNNDPRQPKAGEVNMGGCMGCHGVAQNQDGTDFSFTLNNQLQAPAELSAETLEDKCAEIGLDYNDSSDPPSCVENSP